MRLGEKILRLAKEQGLTLRAISRDSHVPYNTLRAYTRPNSLTVPTAPTGLALARSLRVPCEWLFDDEQSWPPPALIAGPPFPISPWPPDEITWDEVRVALMSYMLDKYKRSLGGESRGGDTSDHITKMIQGEKDRRGRPKPG